MKCTVQIEFPCWTGINMQRELQSCLNKQPLGILGNCTFEAAKTEMSRESPDCIPENKPFMPCLDVDQHMQLATSEAVQKQEGFNYQTISHQI